MKANRRITHLGALRGVEQVTRDFVERCGALGTKLGPILFGLPPKSHRDDDLLTTFLDSLPTGRRYAFEFRDPSWFADAVLDLLRRSNVALCVAESEELSPPREATADFVYLRLRKPAYADRELEDWLKWLSAQARTGRDAFVYTKHDETGAGAEIASRLSGLADVT